MTTALKIIERGASKAGVKGAGNALTDEEVSDGLDILNDIIKEWSALGILKGVAATYDSDVDLKEPEYATPALKSQVGLRMLVEFGGDPTMLAADAANTYRSMLIAKPKEPIVFPDTFPTGSGNYDVLEDDFFPKNYEDNF